MKAHYQCTVCNRYSEDRVNEFISVRSLIIPAGTKPSEPVTEVFSDVSNAWYTSYVQYVYDNNLMKGISGTTEFQPDANITKAQVARVLFNMENQPTVENAKVFDELSDVDRTEWYADAVAWAYETGVVKGDSNAKKFFPNAAVTREELALMMFRYAKYKGLDISVSSDLAGLENVENTSNWALDGVKWAVGSGLISGISKDGVKDLAPQGNASRAQVAAILQRFCEINRSSMTVGFPRNREALFVLRKPRDSRVVL